MNIFTKPPVLNKLFAAWWDSTFVDRLVGILVLQQHIRTEKRKWKQRTMKLIISVIAKSTSIKKRFVDDVVIWGISSYCLSWRLDRLGWLNIFWKSKLGFGLGRANKLRQLNTWQHRCSPWPSVLNTDTWNLCCQLPRQYTF